MERHIVTTADGSHSLFIPQLNEHYHSVHGALQESNHVFIENGLATARNNRQQLNLLEIGMGTGLNVFLSFLYTHHQALIAGNSALHVNYTALEPYPINETQTSQLNYVSLLGADALKNKFDLIHQTGWNVHVTFNDHFNFIKLNTPVETVLLNANSFDLIYFDAFAPAIQPELWTEAIFEKLYHALTHGGFLITYCAKGEVKRALKRVGFTVIPLPGPLGKREITKAVKQ